MKLLLLFLLPIFLFAKNEKLYIPMYFNDIFKTKGYLEIITKVVNKQLKKQNFNIEIIPLNNLDTLVNSYSKGQYKLASISILSYYKNKKVFDKYTKDFNLPMISNTAFSTYYLIAHKEAKRPLDNLHKYAIYMPEVFITSKIWLKNLLYKEKRINLDDFSKNIKYKTKTAGLMNTVFFNKNSIAVIEAHRYDILTELNPQLKKEIKVLRKSEVKYFNSINMAHKNLPEKELQLLKDISQKLEVPFVQSKVVEGRKLGGVYNISKEELNKVIKEIDFYYSIK